MKTLLILRHAKSSWKDDSLPDHERPLNKRGKETAPQMGELIRREGLIPDLILCSTAERAKRTAMLAAEASGYEGEIRELRQLYAAAPETYLETLAGVSDHFDRVLVVGHNPGLEELIQQLTGQIQPMPTAALAWIDLPIDRWSQAGPRLRGKLREIWRPRELD